MPDAVSQAAVVLAHAGSEGQGGATAFTVGIIAVLVLVWAGLAAVAWVFYAAKRREEAGAPKDRSREEGSGAAPRAPPSLEP